MSEPEARSWLPRLAALAALAGTLTLLVAATWAPFLARPSTYLVASAIGVGLIATAGVALRSVGLRAPGVFLLQVLLALGWLQMRFDDLGPLWRSVRAGSVALNTHEAPVSADFVGTAPFLAACALGLAVVIDLLVVGYLRTALVGLPLLLALTIPISTLDAPVPLPLLTGVLALFVALLALEHRWLADDWGREVGTARVRPWLALTLSLAASAAVLGLVGATLLPLGAGIDLSRGDGEGRGLTSVTNPMVEMRRGLVNQSNVPMLRATTDDPTPRYLRLATLDRFDGNRWLPSARDLPRANRISEGIPEAPGLRSTVSGNQYTWDLTYTDSFDSRWLATPYPYVSVEVASGDYRYDENTLDLFNVDDDSVSAPYSGYRVAGFEPSFDAEDLDSAGSPPAGIEKDMTVLPDRMPKRIAQIASDVVREARTDYQRAAALQDWFRTSGGFEYSLWDGPNTTGLAALEQFVTTIKAGYCEQFATAMAVMARSLGVPSRVAVGFGRPASSPRPGEYSYTGKSLHAWTEVYFEGYGWVIFDPTPAVQSGPAPEHTRGIDEAPTPRPGADQTPSAQPSPTRPERAPDGSAPTDEQDGLPAWPWVVLGVLVIAAAAPRVIRDRERRRRVGVLHRAQSSPTDLIDAAWQELRATTLDHRLIWPERRSPRTTLSRLQGQLDLDREQAARVADLARLVEQARYARSADFSDAQRESVLADTEMVLAGVRTAVRPQVRRRARWWPRSLWHTPTDE